MAPHFPYTEPTVWLTTLFDFGRNELMISFDNTSHAEHYRAFNTEAHTYNGENPHHVWLPKPKHSKAIRGVAEGLAIQFQHENEAKEWCDHVGIGRREVSDMREVRLRREWTKSKLEKAIHVA